MKIQFPTMAERAIADWKRKESFARFAKKRDAFVERTWEGWEYIFPDDTRVVVRGTGRNHKMRAELP